VTKPLEITYGEMNAAIDQGHAAPLSRSHGRIVRYAGDWWVEWEKGWLRVNDDQTACDLDMLAERLAAASALAAKDVAERVAAGKDRTEDGDQAADAELRIADLGKPARRTRQAHRAVPDGGGTRPAS
jgi:predicted DNA-binding helix-hairpin-helix protein